MPQLLLTASFKARYHHIVKLLGVDLEKVPFDKVVWYF